MILLIDNYDSFAHNLARYFVRLGQAVHIVRNDEIDVAAVEQFLPQALVISPGPCAPQQAGACLEIVRAVHAQVPILGVCLGHQIIVEALGGKIVRAATPIHGQVSQISHDQDGLFSGIPSPMTVGRYHSLAADVATVPEVLRPTAWTHDRVIMAVEHKRLPVYGVQFHPESILTEHGYTVLANFLRMAGIDTECDAARLSLMERPAVIASEATLPVGPVTF